MATPSITLAVIEKYEALTAANFPNSTRPRIDFGEPPHTVDGATNDPPYVNLLDLGRTVTRADFEGSNFVTTQFQLEVFARDLGDVDQIVNAIRFNGGTVGQGLGFDNGTLGTLDQPRSTHQILPVSEPRRLADRVDKAGARMHGCALAYRVTVLERA